MAKLKRDERVCPFCAETIKAAASRCRFCQSDLPPQVEPESQPGHVPRPEPASLVKSEPASLVKSEDEPADVGPADASDRGRLRAVLPFVRRRLTTVLATLVVLAAAGVGVSWWQAGQGSSEVAPGGSLVGYEARTSVLVEAADLTERTLSYDYKTLENNMEVARARMTPSFRKKYNQTMAQVKANTVKNQIVLQAVVVSSAIIEANEHKAKVLVFVNQTTTAGTGDKRNQQLTRNSLVITLTRGDGDWALSKLTALG